MPPENVVVMSEQARTCQKPYTEDKVQHSREELHGMIEEEKADDGYAREYDCEDGEYQRHNRLTRCTGIKVVKLVYEIIILVKLVYEIPRDRENYHCEDPLDQSNNTNGGLWECCYHGGRSIMLLARLFKFELCVVCVLSGRCAGSR